MIEPTKYFCQLWTKQYRNKTRSYHMMPTRIKQQGEVKKLSAIYTQLCTIVGCLSNHEKRRD